MYKCETCGTEFESKFCPNCGAPAPLGFCPECGATLSPTDKFCPQCGKTLKPADRTRPAEAQEGKAGSASPSLVKLCSLLPYGASVLFALFSVLLFLIFLGSVSAIEGFGTENVYQTMAMAGDMTADLCISCVVFAALGAVHAVCTLLFRFYVPLRAKRIGRVRICSCMEGGLLVFYFVDFLLGCILCGTVNNGLTAPGAGAACLLAFSLLFGLCSPGVLAVKKFLPKLSPAVTSELKRIENERRAALTAPAKPEREELHKPKKPKYPNAECSEELKTKILKQGKTRNLFTVFSVAIVPLLICAVLGLSFSLTFLIVLGSYGALLIVLGTIFGCMYRKKRTRGFNWRSMRAWSNKAMFWTVSICVIVLFAFFISYVSLPYTIIEKIEKRRVLIEVIPAALLFLPLCGLYAIVFYSVAGAIARKGKKLSLAVYGVKHPRLLPEFKESQKAYLLQKDEYRASKIIWRGYRRRLAYFEEGVAYRK